MFSIRVSFSPISGTGVPQMSTLLSSFPFILHSHSIQITVVSWVSQTFMWSFLETGIIIPVLLKNITQKFLRSHNLFTYFSFSPFLVKYISLLFPFSFLLFDSVLIFDIHPPNCTDYTSQTHKTSFFSPPMHLFYL